jgi:2-oxoglutarate dehydrogenase E2 component (dihydrolipoamide succinyltransferase)
MAKIELIMPKMGESVAEATIIKWTKNIGDTIDLDETVVEIATDKVDSEIPSSAKGILVQQLYKENDVVKVGEVIAIIEDNTIQNHDKQQSVSTKENNQPEKLIKQENKTTPQSEISSQTNIKVETDKIGNQSTRFYSPLVKNIAQKENISSNELNKIIGTGRNERVTKKDIINYIENKGLKNNEPSKLETIQPPINQSSNISFQDDHVEIIEMDRMRKIIAKHMISSKAISAHVTSFVEVDMTKIVQWRDQIKDKFFKREGQKITYTPIIFEAVIKAIIDFPLINISVKEESILKHKNIHLGMATALPSGNLIVPVIQHAQEKNLLGLTKSVNDLAQRARNNKLQPDEISNGTFTVTNVGSFGSIMGTPIINQPQVAILALGKIQKKPSVLETEFGDVIGIRSKMFLSLSYDHRVVDGALGGQFLQRIAHYLESFDINREL